MSDTRERIFETVDCDPGIHFNELVRRLDFAPGQVQYHIKRLRRADRIVREPCFGQTHYYAHGFQESERRAIALLRRETTQAIASTLLQSDSIHPRRLAEDLDVARSTIEFHLERLEAAGILTKERPVDGSVSVTLVNPSETRRQLSLVAPPVHAGLADRFERLVDSFGE